MTDKGRRETRIDALLDELNDEQLDSLIDHLHVLTGIPKLSDAEFDLQDERRFVAGCFAAGFNVGRT